MIINSNLIGGCKMARTLGAKNKSKKTGELLEMLKNAAIKEGVPVDKILTKIDELSPELKEKFNKFSDIELELEDEEIDTYKCGACGKTIASQLPICPECGAKLNW